MDTSATDSYVPDEDEEKDPREVTGSAWGHAALGDPV